MTNETEAPERIWAAECRATSSTMWWPDDAGGTGTGYTRTDLSDAKNKRIAELEAKLAKAIEVLERIAQASDVYGVEASAEDYGADTLAYAHKSTCNLARVTITELKGTN